MPRVYNQGKAAQVQETPTIINVALDVGFNAVKMISSAKMENIIKFPSGVIRLNKAPLNRRPAGSPTINLDELTVEAEDGYYYVGESALALLEKDAIRKYNLNRADDENSRVLFKTALGYACPDVTGSYHINLVTGLPNKNIGTDVEDALYDFLMEEFEIKFYTKSGEIITKTIKVDLVNIIPQPDGTLGKLQFHLDPSVKTGFIIAPNETYAVNVGIIDIGHYTTDYCQFKSNSYVEHNNVSGSYQGVEEIYKVMKIRVTKYFADLGLTYTPEDKALDEIVQTGQLFFGGKIYVFEDELKKEKQNLAHRIMDTVLEYWGDGAANRLDKIIITGGGAELLKEELAAEFAERQIQEGIVMEDSDTANVYGYYIYSCIYLNDNFVKDTQQLFDLYVPDFMLEVA